MHLDSTGVSRGTGGWARRLLQTAAFALFALGNPLYLVACSDSDAGSGPGADGYEYDQADMLAVASGLEAEGPFSVGEYQITVQLPFGGERAERLSPSDALAPSFFARAEACGTRSFVAPAAACIDSSELEMQATLRVQRAAQVVEVKATGKMLVASRRLTFASFDFAAESLYLSFAWRNDEGYRHESSGTNETAALAALFER
ncbi:MAG: hypothetical protein M3020_08015 [Myxococcota bacterium]|nr:hypothetical protein [Myxococcota bacterium]